MENPKDVTYNLRNNPTTTDKGKQWKTTQKNKTDRPAKTRKDEEESQIPECSGDRDLEEEYLMEPLETWTLGKDAEEKDGDQSEEEEEEKGQGDSPTRRPEPRSPKSSAAEIPWEELVKHIQGINIQMTENNRQLQAQIEENNMQLKAQMEENNMQLKENNTQLKNLEEKIEENNAYIENKMAYMENKLEEKVEGLIIQMKEDNQQLKDYVKERVEENNLQINIQIKQSEEKMENKIKKMDSKHNENKNEVNMKMEENRQLIANQTKSFETKVSKKFEETRKEFNNEIIRMDANLNVLAEEVTQIGNRVDDKLQEFRGNPTTNPQTIQVICTGGNPSDQNIPKFNGKESNPVEYLDRFIKYYDNIILNRSPKPSIEEIIDNSLEGNANRWWSINKQHMQDIHSFKKEFLNKYWNTDIQKGIKRRLELDRYRSGGRLTRSEYFIEKVALIKNLTPKLEEHEMIDVIVAHFEDQIQDARRVQNLNTILDFEKLLDRIDIDQKNQQIRQYQQKEELFSNYNFNRSTRNNQNRPMDSKFNNSRPRDEYQEHQPNRSYRNSYSHFGTPGKTNGYQVKPYKSEQPKFNPNRSPTTNKRYSTDRAETFHNQVIDSQQYYSRNPRPYDHRQYPTKEQKEVCQTIQMQYHKEIDNKQGNNNSEASSSHRSSSEN